MKWTAISLNLVLLFTAGYRLATMDVLGNDQLLLVIIVFAAPLASLVALIRVGGENWPGLYFKRKTLEEKQRIKNLGGQ